jgi:AcrR family transcriptional regulator
MNHGETKRQIILDAASQLFQLQGFDKTTLLDIAREAGSSKATIYELFQSKERLFVECISTAAELYIKESLAAFSAPSSTASLTLREFSQGFLHIACSAQSVAMQRLIISEASRSEVGALFFAKVTRLLGYVADFLAALMATGFLRPEDPKLAAKHLRALLEAEIIEPLLLHVKEGAPDEKDIISAVGRAVAVFIRAYAPVNR